MVQACKYFPARVAGAMFGVLMICSAPAFAAKVNDNLDLGGAIRARVAGPWH